MKTNPAAYSQKSCFPGLRKLKSPMKNGLLIIIAMLIYLRGEAQMKAAFDQEYQSIQNGVKFGNDLIRLNKIVTDHANPALIDALEAKDDLQFVTYSVTKISDNRYNYTHITIDLREGWSEIFQNLSIAGKINALKAMKSEGKLVLTGRFPSNTVELPKKTNPNQSYSDFYLNMIINLMQQHRGELSEDHLTFAIYQKWEADAGLKTENDLIAFRLAFIRTLYKRYNF